MCVSKVDPCGVYGEQVGHDSIWCAKYQNWVYRPFSGLPRQVSLFSCQDFFVCWTCPGLNYSIEEKVPFKRGKDVLEETEKFCEMLVSC